MLSLQYFNQILTVVLEVLDDSDSSIRELSISLINEMLKNQVCCTPYCGGQIMLCYKVQCHIVLDSVNLINKNALL